MATDRAARCDVDDLAIAGAFMVLGRWPARFFPLSWSIVKYLDPAKLPISEQKQAVRDALDTWAQVADLTFDERAHGDTSARLLISFEPKDHGDGQPFGDRVLAHAYFPDDTEAQTISGDLHLFNKWLWAIGVSANPREAQGRIDLTWTLIHEFGHALGLMHSDVEMAIMFPYIHAQRALHDDDKAAVVSLYGARAAPVPPPPPPDPPTPEPEPPTEEPTMTKRGIDISRYQGSPNWPAVKGDGIDFCIISTGDGRGTNPLWVSQAMGARAVGIDVDLYHFLRFDVPPEEQAALMRQRWDIAVSNGYNPGRYWLDAEDTETKGTLGNVAWLQEVISNLGGIPLGIYSGRWYWLPYMQNSDAFNYLPLWTAAYQQPEPAEDTPLPLLYGGWTGLAVWQWSSTGRVAGISGDVDMNISYEVAGEDEDMSLAEDLMIRVYVNVAHDQFDDGPPRPANSREEALTLAKYRMETYTDSVFGMANNADSNMTTHLTSHPSGGGVDEVRAREIAIQEARKVRYAP